MSPGFGLGFKSPSAATLSRKSCTLFGVVAGVDVAVDAADKLLASTSVTLSLEGTCSWGHWNFSCPDLPQWKHGPGGTEAEASAGGGGDEASAGGDGEEASAGWGGDEASAGGGRDGEEASPPRTLPPRTLAPQTSSREAGRDAGRDAE